MDPRRLRAGEWITAASGAALLASLFLPWYAEGPDSTTGWQSLAAVDVALALIASFAVALLPITAAQRVPAVPMAMSVFATLAGALAVVLVLVRVLALPGEADGRDWALWLALGATLGIVAGALVAMRDERLSPPGRHTDQTGRPAPPPAEIETLPLP